MTQEAVSALPPSAGPESSRPTDARDSSASTPTAWSASFLRSERRVGLHARSLQHVPKSCPVGGETSTTQDALSDTCSLNNEGCPGMSVQDVLPGCLGIVSEQRCLYAAPLDRGAGRLLEITLPQVGSTRAAPRGTCHRGCRPLRPPAGCRLPIGARWAPQLRARNLDRSAPQIPPQLARSKSKCVGQSGGVA
jgi:hypothetical protein